MCFCTFDVRDCFYCRSRVRALGARGVAGVGIAACQMLWVCVGLREWQFHKEASGCDACRFVIVMGLVLGYEKCAGVCRGRMFYMSRSLCDSIYARSGGSLSWGLVVLRPR